jgi:hypothetical protein
MVVEDTKQYKTSKGYSLSPVNIEWLTLHAAQKTGEGNGYISASEVLDRLVTAAREEEEMLQKKAGKR